MMQRREEIAPGVVRGEFFTPLENGRVRCDICPRACTLHDGQRAFCFIRQAQNGAVVLTSYGRSTGFCIDPIEKKPLNHFFPGSAILSFGTAGCNLGCKFCQNWDISKAHEVARLSSRASPEAIARAAQQQGCTSVAFTYNDPVIFHEYAIDTAQACHELGIKAVAVTAGYHSPAARKNFYQFMDAANVDLKAFTEEFYHKTCYGHLDPVLDTLRYIKEETGVWLEVTTLLIPGLNDSDDELKRLSEWFLKTLGADVPLHFSAFHPDFKMMEVSPTPPETLVRAQKSAQSAGLRYVYTGNVNDKRGQSTYCPSCQTCVIGRNWYNLYEWGLQSGRCAKCGEKIVGHFLAQPGDWGAKRKPLFIAP